MHQDTAYSSSEPDLSRVASIVVVPKTNRVETVTTSSAVVTTTTSFVDTQASAGSITVTSSTEPPSRINHPVGGGGLFVHTPRKATKTPFCKRCKVRGHTIHECQRPILFCQYCLMRGHQTSDCRRLMEESNTRRRPAEYPALPAQRTIRPAFDVSVYAEYPSTSQGRQSYPPSTQTSQEYDEVVPRAWGTP